MYPCQPQLETSGGPRPERLGGELRAGKLIFQFGYEVQAKLTLALGFPICLQWPPSPLGYSGDSGNSGHDQACSRQGVPWGQISYGGLSLTSWICSYLA